MSLVVLAYDFSTQIVEPPTGNQLRLNAAHPYTAVTRMWLRNLTTDGADVRLLLLEVPTGSRMVVQDKNDSGLYGDFRTTAAPVDKTSYVEFRVSWTANGLALLNQGASVFISTPVAPVPEPPAAGPTIPYPYSHVAIPVPLVSLAVAKAQLRVTDATHDADIQQKLEAAQHAVVARLAYAADPACTEATIAENDPTGRSWCC